VQEVFAPERRRNEFLRWGRSAVPCFALHPNLEGNTPNEGFRPQDVCFSAGYVFVPGMQCLKTFCPMRTVPPCRASHSKGIIHEQQFDP